MSAPDRFAATTEAVIHLWDRWMELASAQAQRRQTPYVLELQTICRESGCTIPELDAFARAARKPPTLLICGGDGCLFSEIAGRFGYCWTPVTLPNNPIIWRLRSGERPGVWLCRGHERRELSQRSLAKMVDMKDPQAEVIRIEAELSASSPFALIWMPFPRHFSDSLENSAKLEILLSHRACLILDPETPDPLADTLTGMGQVVLRMNSFGLALADADERNSALQRILEVTTESFDKAEEADAVLWDWVAARTRLRIDQNKGLFNSLVSQYDTKLTAIRHVLGHYGSDGQHGVGSVCDSYLQSRISSSACAPLSDPQKPIPQADTFLAAMALPTLWTRVEEHVTDRMSDLVAALTDMVKKLDLRRIALADVNFRWNAKALAPKLEACLNADRVVPAVSSKRGGIIRNLVPHKQAAAFERRELLNRTARAVVQCIEAEFAQWNGALMKEIENRILLQMAASLADHGYSDPDALRSATSGLERLEQALNAEQTSAKPAEAVVCEWLELVSARHWIPLHQIR